MAISLTCTCGAILEIDDKFRGQRIPCPDCNRLLDTIPPPPPPQATSGWALASLILSLAGALTLIGPIAGAVCGAVGVVQIKRNPKLGGVRIAQAGIVLGGLFTLVSVWALVGTEFLGLDGFLRLYVSGKDVKYSTETTIKYQAPNPTFSYWINRPAFGWGLRQPDGGSATPEDLLLVNLWEDAHIVLFNVRPDDVDKADDVATQAKDVRTLAIAAFLKTNLARRLAKSKNDELEMPREEKIQVRGEPTKAREQEFTVEFNWSPIPRKFLFRVFEQRSRVNVAVGGTRSSRFERLEEILRAALASCKIEDPN